MSAPGADVELSKLASVEHDPRFNKALVGLVGLAVLVRSLPEPKKNKAHEVHAAARDMEPHETASSAQRGSFAAATSSPEEKVSSKFAVEAEASPPPPPPPPALADGAEPLGVAGTWHVYTLAGALYALNVAGAAEPLRLSPDGVRVGSVFVGDSSTASSGGGGVLAELEGCAPGTAALYRFELPAAGDAAASAAPAPQLDTCPPTESGEHLVTWLAEEAAAPDGTRRPVAALGALVRGDGRYSLRMRAHEAAHIGSATWLATCRRLNLPEPPVDPHAPPTMGEWRTVASWGEDEPKVLVGLRGGNAWVHDARKRLSTAYTADGRASELRLP